MKILLTLLLCALVLIGCKETKNEPAKASIPEVETTSNSEVQPEVLIAKKAGIDTWNQVEEVQFTFNVSKEDKILSSRKWWWHPKTNEVQLVAKGDTVQFNRKKLDTENAQSADRSFVNDVYWLLPQFKMVWDEGTKISTPQPNMIRLEYTGDGGYTPGDRYDFTLDENQQIESWEYYPSGAQEPSMQTTFEDYKNFNGISIAQQHKSMEADFNIFFTDVKVLKSMD